jgi:hypothetical protein
MLGDAGHFFVHSPDLFANNPTGAAFSVTLHRHVWPADWANRGELQVRVLAPDGSVATTGAIPGGQGRVQLAVAAGRPGVYRIAVTPAGSGMMWLESSLGQLVAGCGPWDGDPQATGIHERFYRNLNVHAMVPRRWYFHVPAGTKSFEVATRILPFQSHREDYGFFVMSPRGQRVAAFFGGRSLRRDLPPTGELRAQEIDVDEGCAGRFWSLWVVNGDSHAFSDLALLLRGVPACLAPTPEQWFDPATGRAPPRPIYDEAPVRLREQPDQPSLDKYLWTPATFLGDEDYNGWRGEQTLFLWNPDNRPLTLGIGAYIADEGARFPVRARITAPDGSVALEQEGRFGHGASHRLDLPARGGGGLSRRPRRRPLVPVERTCDPHRHRWSSASRRCALRPRCRHRPALVLQGPGRHPVLHRRRSRAAAGACSQPGGARARPVGRGCARAGRGRQAGAGGRPSRAG